MSKKITNIAHRGASSYAPENTTAAFDLAIEMGVKHIELDVHSSKDNHLVVIHDDTLDRTTNGHGNVNDFTLKELQSLDAGSWFSEKYSNENTLYIKNNRWKRWNSCFTLLEIGKKPFKEKRDSGFMDRRNFKKVG